MKKDLIYFGSQGLTTTSANHIANLAKEWQTPIKEHLNSVNFVNESVEVIGNDNITITKVAWNSNEIESVYEMLNNVAEADLLVAWLREAIKAKDSLLKEINNYNLEEWCSENNIELPKRPYIEGVISEDYYMSTLTIKERQEWLKCNQMCAVLGKYIHPDGSFSEARELLSSIQVHPNVVHGSGRDTIITRWTVGVEPKVVDSVFFKLQAQYREYQAQLNGYKHKCELAIQEDNDIKSSNYSVALQHYNADISELTDQFENWKKEKKKEIANFKIIIPNDLKDIYNFINSLGK